VIGFGAGDATASAAVVGPDGRIVVVGGESRLSSLDGVALRVGGMAAARLTATGQLDPTFGSGGTVTIPFPVGQFDRAEAYTASLDPDGRIVFGGYAVQDGRRSTRGVGMDFWATTPAPAAVRLTSDGQLDTTFGAGGRVLVPVLPMRTAGSGFRAVSVLADGRVVLAGAATDATSPPDASIAGLAVRLTAAGQFDPTYGSGGRFYAPVPGFVAAIDAQHRVVLAGFAAAYRLTADGAADTGFGVNGRVNFGNLPGVVQAGETATVTDATARPNGDLLLSLSTSAGTPGSQGGRVIQLTGSSPPAGFVAASPGAVVAGGRADGTIQVLTPTAGVYAAAGRPRSTPGSAAPSGPRSPT
jgi:uncharacterized delta-60 repeat protein